MRQIERTTAFKSDYKRENRGRYRKILEQEFSDLLGLLATDMPLPARCCDHGLSGEWADHRDCHIRPDLVLIYRKPDKKLQLVRLGSHSELGL